ncbi:MAG: hypothetical protein AAFY65_17295 [Pseudomonadota bacterium]
MTPELTLLLINVVFLLFAYLWVYPGLTNKRITVILRYDLIISVAGLVVGGLLYAGKGLGFSLIFFDAPWWVFQLVTFMALELPFWERFRRKYNVSLDFDDRDP